MFNKFLGDFPPELATSPLPGLSVESNPLESQLDGKKSASTSATDEADDASKVCLIISSQVYLRDASSELLFSGLPFVDRRVQQGRKFLRLQTSSTASKFVLEEETHAEEASTKRLKGRKNDHVVILTK